MSGLLLLLSALLKRASEVLKRAVFSLVGFMSGYNIAIITEKTKTELSSLIPDHRSELGGGCLVKQLTYAAIKSNLLDRSKHSVVKRGGLGYYGTYGNTGHANRWP